MCRRLRSEGLPSLNERTALLDQVLATHAVKPEDERLFSKGQLDATTCLPVGEDSHPQRADETRGALSSRSE